MAVVICIPAALRPLTGGRDRIHLDSSPATVGEALQELGRLSPGVRDRVLTEEGSVRPHVNLFVGSANVRETGGLGTPLRDGSEIWILPAVSGGRAAGASTPPSGDEAPRGRSATGGRSATLTSPSARGRDGDI